MVDCTDWISLVGYVYYLFVVELFVGEGFDNMTEKRFTRVITGSDGSFHYWDKVTDERITSTLELEDKLNELNEENEQLKHDATVLIQANQDYRRENVQLKQFQTDVFNCIDNLIERAKQSESGNQYKLGAIQVLQTLEKELKR